MRRYSVSYCTDTCSNRDLQNTSKLTTFESVPVCLSFYVRIEANKVDPDQTTPTGAV